jgi:hypothetical protein
MPEITDAQLAAFNSRVNVEPVDASEIEPGCQLYVRELNGLELVETLAAFQQAGNDIVLQYKAMVGALAIGVCDETGAPRLLEDTVYRLPLPLRDRLWSALAELNGIGESVDDQSAEKNFEDPQTGNSRAA